MECEICGRANFFSNQTLSRHKARKHGTQPKNDEGTWLSQLLPHVQIGPKFDERFKHPFTCIVAGPTKAGKTEFVKKFVLNLDSLVSVKPKNVYWCYTEWQPTYENIPAQFIKANQLESLNLRNCEPKLIVLDDMMRETNGNSAITDIFTKGSHHWNMSVIHITQDIFYDKKRTNRINCQYLVLMKNPGDLLTPMNLAKQMGNSAKFMKAYRAATALPHGYLLVDMEQNTPDLYRLRTNIFPDELTVFY